MWRYFVLRLFISFVLFISLDRLWAQGFTDSEASDCTDPTEIAINSGGLSLISSGDYETAKIKLIGYTSGDYRIRNLKRYKHLGPKWNYQGTSKKLSKLRAAEIRQDLSVHGIDQERIEIEGKGGENMIITNPLSHQESLVNMRVEMRVFDI